MLRSIRSLLACHIQAGASSFNQLCRKPLATMMTVVVIAIALALPALLWTMTSNLGRLTANIQRNGNISLYLKTSLSTEAQVSFLNQIKLLPGVGQASLKTSEEGLNELVLQEGMNDIMRLLPDNPLPAVINVIPALSLNQPAKLEYLYHQLKASPEVDQAKLDMQWVNRMNALLGFASQVTHMLMLLLASAVVLVVGNTLRLAIYTRHEEIQVLKLIGATDPFILRPFLYAGIWYGFLGAFIAVLLVNIVTLSLGMAVNKLAHVYQMNYPFYGMSFGQILQLIAFAIILGWLGARLSVKRHLAFIEPYS